MHAYLLEEVGGLAACTAPTCGVSQNRNQSLKMLGGKRIDTHANCYSVCLVRRRIICFFFCLPLAQLITILPQNFCPSIYKP